MLPGYVYNGIMIPVEDVANAGLDASTIGVVASKITKRAAEIVL